MKNQKWILEWSHKQQCFHIDMLWKSLNSNRGSYLLGGHNDYIPLGIYDTVEEADADCAKLAKLKEKMNINAG